MVISLGWHDPLNKQAEKVKVCNVNFNQIIDRRVRRNTVPKDVQHIQEAIVGAIADALAHEINLALG